jgi:hypothetical protein
MHQCAVPMRDRRRLGHGLDHAGFVVGEHDRHERPAAAGGQHRFQRHQIDHAAGRDGDAFGLRHGPRHAVMLDRGCQDAIRRDAAKRRAASIAWRATRPKPCADEGVPTRASASAIAAATSGNTGAEALWSR